MEILVDRSFLEALDAQEGLRLTKVSAFLGHMRMSRCRDSGNSRGLFGYEFFTRWQQSIMKRIDEPCSAHRAAERQARDGGLLGTVIIVLKPTH